MWLLMCSFTTDWLYMTQPWVQPTGSDRARGDIISWFGNESAIPVQYHAKLEKY